MHDARDGFHDIKILPEPVVGSSSSGWLGLLLGLALLGALLYFLHKKSKASRDSGPKPFEVSKNKLKLLESRRKKANLNLREYGEELSYIVREFLENTYKIPALEMTAKELKEELPKHTESNSDLSKLIEFCSFLAYSDKPEEKYSVDSKALKDAGTNSLKILRDINFTLSQDEQPS